MNPIAENRAAREAADERHLCTGNPAGRRSCDEHAAALAGPEFTPAELEAAAERSPT